MFERMCSLSAYEIIMGEYHHTAILQRLNIHHVNGGHNVFYSLPAFERTEDWENIPVIMPTADPTSGHPEDFDAIFGGNIPEGYQKVGFITGAHIPDEGAARLEADVVLDDPRAEELAKAGTLALSTAFVSDYTKVGENEYEITGRIRPNHVLAFEQGICPSCYPNDQGCMITNQVEYNTMTEEVKTESGVDADFSETQKGFFANMIEKIVNACAPKKEERNEVEEVPVEETTTAATDDIEALKSEIENLKAAVSERDAIISEMKAEKEQQEKDEAWNTLANTLPPAWKENEAETRAEFESNPAAFTTKLMNHMQKFANTEVKAEGKTECGCQLTEEQKLKNRVESNGKKIGFTPMED